MRTKNLSPLYAGRLKSEHRDAFNNATIGIVLPQKGEIGKLKLIKN
ncbi:MAG: hypothetical protein LBT50_09925 [Prevotellaceae bacterium]|jgi:hypothetical protein|nr:hypothetical protein [Prevotellaceae bacterium]